MKSHYSKVHDGKKSHKCEVCGGTFIKKNILTKHLKAVHGSQNKTEKMYEMKSSEKLYECTICHSAFELPISLGEHVETHFPTNKQKEDKQGTKNESNSEKGSKQKAKHETSFQTDAENMYICTLCNMRFAKSDSLEDHKKECKKTKSNVKMEIISEKEVKIEKNLTIRFAEKHVQIKNELQDDANYYQENPH